MTASMAVGWRGALNGRLLHLRKEVDLHEATHVFFPSYTDETKACRGSQESKTRFVFDLFDLVYCFSCGRNINIRKFDVKRVFSFKVD